MQYDFTTVVSRRDTGSSKWDDMYAQNPHVPEGVIPLSVADMELKNPPQIARGVAEYLQGAVLGYTGPTRRFTDAIAGWQRRRNGWEIQPEWIVDYPGVVTAFFHLTKFLTQPGDGVILLTPVYYPFYEAVRNSGRTLAECPLLYRDGRYAIDFACLEEKARDPKNKLLLFCSPHNPVGRLWKREELERVGEICLRNGVRIISDEIHSDLVLERDRRHIPMASLSEELARITVTCGAPSKTFNLAGMVTSYLIIPNEETRRLVGEGRQREGVFYCNLAGYRALEIAYDQCEDWLEELLALLRSNREMMEKFLAEKIPQIRPVPLEATYLQWLDCSGLGMGEEELDHFMREEAYWFTDPGALFGRAAGQFQRVNLACPAAALQAALDRLLAARMRRGGGTPPAFGG